MEKDQLGLPLEYGELSEYFDVHNICDDTDAKNSEIERVLRKHGVKTVLDLTCGTGSQVFWLAKHGYKVVGADFSPALLDIARDKARKENVDVTFIDGDMRTLKVGRFDAVITIFNAVGHLTKADFEQAIRNIYDNLNDGGLYVFDIFNVDAITNEIIKDFAMDIKKEVNGTHIHNIQYSTIDRERGRLTSFDHYTIQKGKQKPRVIKHQFTLQIYTAEELREMLSRNGFETLDQYGMDGKTFVKETTTNILTVARKKNNA